MKILFRNTDAGKVKKNYLFFAVFSGSFLVLSSLLYSIYQLIVNKTISDTLFISLTLGESLFVLYAGYRILKFVIRNEADFNSVSLNSTDPEKISKEYSNLINIFNHFRILLPVILLWSITMGLMPVLQKYWKEDVTLNILYGSFLFFTNIITSYFLMVLIQFFRLSWKLWGLIHVELWKRENASARFMFNITKLIVIIAAIYMTSSLMAWLTSPKIPFGPIIIIFIIFSVILLIGCITLPTIPYIRKLSGLKMEALSQIDGRIQNEYQAILDILHGTGKEVSFGKMNSLIEMRQKIETINVFPFRLETITASLSIILISLLPIFLEYIVKNVIKLNF